MTQPETGKQVTRWTAEVLRRTSAVLGGRMVGVWQVSVSNGLVPVAFNTTEALAWDATPDVREALLRTALPAPPGSRWIAGRLADGSQWCVAPVRDQAPDPPPRAQERRSRERLALELAGLCLGLSSQRASAGGTTRSEPDLFQRFTEQLGTFAGDIANPLSMARTAVARSRASLDGSEPLDKAERQKLADDLRVAARALEQAVGFVRTVQERAQAVVSRGETLDVVQVVWSCVDDERAQATLRGATLELQTLAYVVSVPGDAEDLRKVVGTMLRAAVQGLQGRAGTVRVAVEDVGPVVRLTVRAPSVEGVGAEAAAMAEARRLVETMFGGTLTLTSLPGEGTTISMALPVPSHRFRDPALWWET